MANTYTQLYIHLVFVVKHRESLISSDIRDKVQRFMTGHLQNKEHKLLAIYLMPDHGHILVGLNPKYSISEMTKLLKTSTTAYINDRKLTRRRFRWQVGYGAFSHSKRELDRVIRYIRNQPFHHSSRSFKKEYLTLLKRYDIDYDAKYLFDFFEE